MSNYYRMLFNDFIEESALRADSFLEDELVIDVNDLLAYLDDLEKGSK